ncbi:MAG: pantoate--beta-alanine ligase [Ignavibacteriaceae bacterium]
MKTITTVKEMQQFSGELKKEGKSIGFVPTMGYLHEGHLSLVEKSNSLCDVTVVSIFVNPKQFSPSEDLKNYPKDFKRDEKLLSYKNVDVIFYPSVEEIYPKNYQTFVEVADLTKHLEGEFRPAHYKGVVTVVTILFNCVNPDYVFFGQKDAQQSVIIKKLIEDLKFNIKIEVCPIKREEDGLAMSSRNIYLSKKEREDSLVLSRAISFGKKLIEDGERTAGKIIFKMIEKIQKIPSAELDYVQIVNVENFNLVSELREGENYYILIACKIGKTRLIDNILVKL